MPNPLSPQIIALIERQFGTLRRPITPESDMRELGLDCLDLMFLALVLEKEFNVAIPDAAIKSWRTVQDVVEWVERMRKGRRPR